MYDFSSWSASFIRVQRKMNLINKILTGILLIVLIALFMKIFYSVDDFITIQKPGMRIAKHEQA